MSLEEALAANTAATKENSALLERVVAGQEAAMAKLEVSPKTTRKKKEEPAAPQGESSDSASAGSAATETPAAGAASASEATGVAAIVAGITDADGMKAYVSGFTGATEDQTERARRVHLLKDIAAKCGVEPKFPAILPHAKTVVFLIERDKAGQPVDVNAAYDLDGPVDQEVAPAAGADDDFG